MLALLAIVLQALPAVGDAVPMGRRGVGYQLTILNRGEFPDHVLLVYPTSNQGFAYVLEDGKPITSVLRPKDWKGEASRIYAMSRAAFDKWAGAAPHRYPHGDNGEVVMVVPSPPSGALVASANIAPPGLVMEQSPIQAIERTFRIMALDDRKFELVLVEEVEVHTGGKRVRRKVP